MIKKIIRYQKNYLYDVAGGSFLLGFMTIPVVLALLVLAAIITAVVLINKSQKKILEKQSKNKDNNLK